MLSGQASRGVLASQKKHTTYYRLHSAVYDGAPRLRIVDITA